MTRICAWCLALLDGSDADDSTPTHGICPPCRARIEKEWERIQAGRPLPRPSFRAALGSSWRGLRRRLVLALGRWARSR